MRHLIEVLTGRVLKLRSIHLFRPMKKRHTYSPPAPKLSDVEIEKQLQIIGRQIRSRRQARTTMERFSFEINLSKSAMGRCETGGDMKLSTLLKVIHGLEVKADDFFKGLK